MVLVKCLVGKEMKRKGRATEKEVAAHLGAIVLFTCGMGQSGLRNQKRMSFLKSPTPKMIQQTLQNGLVCKIQMISDFTCH